jgi:hypothetical protein
MRLVHMFLADLFLFDNNSCMYYSSIAVVTQKLRSALFISLEK